MLLGRFQSCLLMHKVCTQYRLYLNCYKNDSDEACMYKLVLKMLCTYTAQTLYIICTYSVHTLYRPNTVKVPTMYMSVQNYEFCTGLVRTFELQV
jgi:hypothetical protein